MNLALFLTTAASVSLCFMAGGCAEDCEDIHCPDELVVEFHPAGGRFPPGEYQFEVASDEGGARSCTATVTGETLESGVCSAAGVFLHASLRCEGEACRTSPPETRQVYQMVIPGNPTPISITARRDGAVLAETAAVPQYRLCGCEPNGRFGSVSVSVN